MLPREKHAGRGQPRKEISQAAILLPKLADIGIEENRARRAKKLNATSKPKRKQIVEKLKTDGKGCHAGCALNLCVVGRLAVKRRVVSGSEQSLRRRTGATHGRLRL
jgi:hypothetical protein